MNHPLTVSNYGVYQHRLFDEVRVSSDETIRSACEKHDIPAHIADYILNLTGGYPEHMSRVLKNWITNGRQSRLDADTRRWLLDQSVNTFSQHFVQKIDRPGDTTFRDALVDLYHGCNLETAVELLFHHPWRHILLRDNTLRARALGAAALRLMSETAAFTKDPPSTHLIDIATNFYRRGKYVDAAQLLDSIRGPVTSLHGRFLRAHTNIMKSIYGPSTQISTNSDWKRTLDAIEEARALLFQENTRILDADILDSRYRELDEVARAISIVSQRNKPERIVDYLAGIRNPKPEAINVKAACFLMLILLQRAQLIYDNDLACSAILPLQEQMLRVWSFRVHHLDYYSARQIADDIWEVAIREYDLRNTHSDRRMTRVLAGKQFKEVTTFAFISHACSISHDVPSLADTFDELHKDISCLGKLRTPHAHAVCFRSAVERKHYFELTERWFRRLLDRCIKECSYNQLEAIAEPLPLVDSGGNLEW